MAEIEKITEYILDKARKEAGLIIENAREECALIIQRAKQDAKLAGEDIISKARNEYEDIIRRANSLLVRKKSELNLEIKNRAVNSVIAQAKEDILAMDDESYNAFIMRLIAENASGSEGKITFNAADKKRLSAPVLSLIKEKSLVIEDECADISGGFILSYGKVYINCCIDAIFKEREEEFTDCVSSVIFGQ